MAKLNPVQFLRNAARNSPWLVIAVALHAVIIAVMSVIYLAGKPEADHVVPVNVTLAAPKVEVEQPEEVQERKAPPKNAEEEIVDYNHEMDYQVADENPDLTQEVGDPTADNSNGSPGGTAIGAGLGPGHFGSGVSTFSTRIGGRGVKGRAGGATQGTQEAVRFGLLWLIRHQLPDGSWDPTALPGCCVNDKKCVGPNEKYQDFWHQGVTGLSLLAFLGAGYNFDSKQNIVDVVQGKKYFMGPVILNGLKWLKTRQQEDGSFGPEQHVYNQALCALALTEAYGLSKNLVWREPAQRAIDWLVRAQKTNPDGTGALWGWRYHSLVDVQAAKAVLDERKRVLDEKRAPFEAKKEALDGERTALETQKDKLKPEEYEAALGKIRTQMKEVELALKAFDPEVQEISASLQKVIPELYDSDMSVTTWVIMAFKSAEASGLKVPHEAFEGGKSFVLSVSQDDGLAGYLTRAGAGRPVGAIGGKGENFHYHVGTMSALAMLCRTFVDHDIDDPFLEKAAQQLVKDIPEISKDKNSIDYYYWYYASLALNQFDGPDSPRKGSRYWDQWNRAMNEAVLGTQDDHEKACTRGGWIVPDRWAISGGPIYATAMNVLTLEVYYRYENAFGSGSRFDLSKKPKPKKAEGGKSEGK